MSEMTKEACFSLVPPQLNEGGPLRQRKREGSEVGSAQINQEATPVQGAEKGDQSG